MGFLESKPWYPARPRPFKTNGLDGSPPPTATCRLVGSSARSIKTDPDAKTSEMTTGGLG